MSEINWNYVNLKDGDGEYLMDNIDVSVYTETGYIPLKVRRRLKDINTQRINKETMFIKRIINFARNIIK